MRGSKPSSLFVYGFLLSVVLSFSAASCTYSTEDHELISTIPGTGGHHPFDEEDGTMAVDVSGNGFHGTIFNASRVPGKVGGAVSLGSPGSRVEIYFPEGLFDSQEISVEAWIRLATVDPGSVHLIVSDVYSYELRVNDGRLEFLIGGDDSPQPVVVSNVALSAGEWHYIAVTYDGAVARLYVNAVQDGSANLPISLALSSGTIYIGGTGSGDGEVFRGEIDELRISNAVRTLEEVEDFYRSTR